LADEILFGNFQSLAEGNERFAATFALPVDTPGSTLISRRPFARLATSELDDPLAYRYDETDAIAYCDNVLVPWVSVFLQSCGHGPSSLCRHSADANGILTVPVGTEFATRHTRYEIFYYRAPAVALNRIRHFFRWQDVDAQADRALKSIGTTTILSSAESAMMPAAGRIALATSD
jgi:hypothetical protein